MVSATARLLLHPTGSWSSPTFSTLMPYGYRGGVFWLRAGLTAPGDLAGLDVDALRRHIAADAIVFQIEQAQGRNSFEPLATLEFGRELDSSWPPEDVSFDPTSTPPQRSPCCPTGWLRCGVAPTAAADRAATPSSRRFPVRRSGYVQHMLTVVAPRLPEAVGPVSSQVVEALHTGRADALTGTSASALADETDPYGLDLHLALYTCYELHYRGFADVDPGWEWDPALLGLRAGLERTFLDAVRTEVGEIEDDATAADEMAALAVEPAEGRGCRTTCATTDPGIRCGSISSTARCTTSKRATRTHGRSPTDGSGQSVLRRR